MTKFYLVPESGNETNLVKISASGFVPENSYLIPDELAQEDAAWLEVAATEGEFGEAVWVVQVNAQLKAQVLAEREAARVAAEAAAQQEAMLNMIAQREAAGQRIVRKFKLRNTLAPITIADTQKLFDMPLVVKLLNQLNEGSLDTALDTLSQVRANSAIMAELASIQAPVINDAYLASIVAEIQEIIS